MKPPVLLTALACLALAAAPALAAPKKPAKSAAAKPAAPVAPAKTLADLLAASKDLTSFAAALKTAGLADTLAGPGPFTVFAPTNAAFARLPADAVKPENQSALTNVLNYHLAAGAVTTADLTASAAAHDGKASLTALQGDVLTFSKSGKAWKITDAKGGAATLTSPDLAASNGVLHVIDAVLAPN